LDDVEQLPCSSETTAGGCRSVQHAPRLRPHRDAWGAASRACPVERPAGAGGTDIRAAVITSGFLVDAAHSVDRDLSTKELLDLGRLGRGSVLAASTVSSAVSITAVSMLI